MIADSILVAVVSLILQDAIRDFATVGSLRRKADGIVETSR